jgi:hypothetical protein
MVAQYAREDKLSMSSLVNSAQRGDLGPRNIPFLSALAEK